MKIAFKSKLGLNKANMERLETINEIIEDYAAQDFVLTLRQLYYQLVRRNIVPNKQTEYNKLSVLLTKGRMAGIVDWNAIEDRGRQPRKPFEADSVEHALRIISDAYRINRQDEQENYIEVWVEKDALSNVFARVTEPYHVSLMVNKGYSSCSAMFAAATRFKRANSRGQEVKLLYFGDHDPSGKDMVRDIAARLQEMRVRNFEVINPALTMQQIKQYDPPENPAKISDPRAGWYIEKYGYSSWELDALPPQVLMQIIKEQVLEYMDMDLFKQQLIKEANEKQHILSFAESYNPDEAGFDNNIDIDESEFDF